jgi:hypothetical protein
VQAVQANKHRREVVFKVGDKVRLSTANLRLPSTMSKKLVARYLGPFTVEKVVNPVAYKLKLPSSLKIHPVFHVSVLQPWRVDHEHPEHVHPGPPQALDAEDGQWLVEKLLDKRVVRCGRKQVVEYLVRWKGFGPEDDLWTPQRDVGADLFAEYEATHHAQIPVQRRSTRRSHRFRS